MYEFKWKIDFTKIMSNNCELPNGKNIFINLMDSGLTSAYKDGLNRDTIRRSFNISNKIENADKDTIELMDDEFELIKETFNKAKFQAQYKKMLIQIYEAIDEAKKIKKEDK